MDASTANKESEIDHHHRPQKEIAPAISQYLSSQSYGVGFEAWQTYYGLVGERSAFATWQRSHAIVHEAWNEVAKAVLEDFMVWYDSGHYTEET